MKSFGFAAILALIMGATAIAQSSVSLDGNAISIQFKGAKIAENAPIAFHTSADLVFKGATVPKGDYSLYVIPAAGKWTLVINKATGAKAAIHDPKLDVGRVAMVMGSASAPAAAAKVALNKVAALAAKIEIASENAVATAQFRLDRVAGDSEW